MKRVDLSSLFKAVSDLALMTERLVRPIDVMQNNGTLWITFDNMGPSIGRHLKIIEDITVSLDMPVTAGAVTSYRSTLGKLTYTKNANNAFGLTQNIADALRRDYDHLITGLSRELTLYRAFLIAPSEARNVDNAVNQFGPEVIAAFPGVESDIVSAAECQSFELWTASVMHMMRVAERGVAAFAGHLPIPVGKTWGGTISEILKALDDAKGSKASGELKDRLQEDQSFKQWVSEVASYLNFVKDGFRNPAMHPELSFDRDQAVAIFNNTRSLMRALAKRITQDANML